PLRWILFGWREGFAAGAAELWRVAGGQQVREGAAGFALDLGDGLCLLRSLDLDLDGADFRVDGAAQHRGRIDAGPRQQPLDRAVAGIVIVLTLGVVGRQPHGVVLFVHVRGRKFSISHEAFEDLIGGREIEALQLLAGLLEEVRPGKERARLLDQLFADGKGAIARHFVAQLVRDVAGRQDDRGDPLVEQRQAETVWSAGGESRQLDEREVGGAAGAVLFNQAVTIVIGADGVLGFDEALGPAGQGVDALALLARRVVEITFVDPGHDRLDDG